jgi:hypothetical protein
MIVEPPLCTGKSDRRCSATVDQSEICLKSGEGLRLAEIGSQGDFTRVDIR